MNVLRLYIERKALKVQRKRDFTMKYRAEPYMRFRPSEVIGDTKGMFDFEWQHIKRKPDKRWFQWYGKESIGQLRYRNYKR